MFYKKDKFLITHNTMNKSTTQITRKVILDCDTGEDDALAILVAIRNKLPLKYIVTSYGNSTLEDATRNTSNILSLAQAKDIIVLPGSTHPIKPHKVQQGHSAGDFVGKNGLCNTELPQSNYKNIVALSEDMFTNKLVDILKQQKKTTYIITGPCTNFAKACLLLKDEIREYVDKVYIMGGAIHVAGNSGPKDNISQKKLAEFNFYCDPFATDIVLSSGLPIYLITWDITSTITIPYKAIQKFTSNTQVGKFVITLMNNFFTYYGLSHERNFELNDPITVLAHIGYGSYQTKKIKIITTKDHFGQTIIDPNGENVHYFTLSENQKKEAIKKILRDIQVAVTKDSTK